MQYYEKERKVPQELADYLEKLTKSSQISLAIYHFSTCF